MRRFENMKIKLTFFAFYDRILDMSSKLRF